MHHHLVNTLLAKAINPLRNKAPIIPTNKIVKITIPNAPINIDIVASLKENYIINAIIKRPKNPLKILIL
jgi:hypothetical protein